MPRALSPFRGTMTPRTTTTPRHDLDYTGAVIPAPREQEQRMWPGLWWSEQRHGAMEAYDNWCREKDLQNEYNERKLIGLHRAQEAQVALSDRNFWTRMEACDQRYEDSKNDMRAVVEGPGVANALRELSRGIRDEAHEMWRRHWEAHTSESNTRLAALHMAQDAAGHTTDHAINNYRFYGPIATQNATGAVLEREAAEEARRKAVIMRAAEESGDRLTATMYHLSRAQLMSQKARGEVDFWGDQEEVRRKVREIVTKENEELQRVFKEYAQHDAQERQRLRDDEEGERIERFNELSCVRQNRAAAEDEADRCEEIRRLAEEEANRSEYKRAERDALEMEAVIKQLEMECLTRGMSHQL